MKSSGRFSVALHVLLHLSDAPGEPSTSEHLAVCARTNPVVIRRTLGRLRKAGVVSSAPGHGGGWRLARPADRITLGEIHAALEDESLLKLSIGAPDEGCRVERAVELTLDDIVRDAQALIAERLGHITLADLAMRTRTTGRA